MNTFRLTPASKWRPEQDIWLSEVRQRCGVVATAVRAGMKARRIKSQRFDPLRDRLVRPLAVASADGHLIAWAHVRSLDALAHEGWPEPIGGRWLLFGEGRAFGCTLGEDPKERSQLFEVLRAAAREAMTGEGCSFKRVEAEMAAGGYSFHRSQLSLMLSGRQGKLPIELFDGLFRVCGQSLAWALTAA